MKYSITRYLSSSEKLSG